MNISTDTRSKNVEEDQPKKKFIPAAQPFVTTLAVSSTHVYFGTYDGLIRRLEINAKGTDLETWTGHTGRITCSAWDGSLLYTGASDNTIRVWNANGNCIHVKVCFLSVH